MQATTRRKIFIISVFLIVIVGVGYGFMPKPVPVDIVKAVRSGMKVIVEEEGKTRVRDRFIISAPVPGYLRRVELKVGDIVNKGQPVATVEPLRSVALDPRSRAEAEAGVAAFLSAKAAADERVRAAAAGADYADKNLERQRKLYESGYISRDIFEQADAETKRAAAGLLAAEASLKTAAAELGRARAALGHSADEGVADRKRNVIIRSPVGGRVLKLQRESEGVVNAGEPLIDIGDPGSLEVKMEVLSADAVMISPGTRVIFERWGGGPPLSGKVRIVEPAAFTKISSLGVEEQRVLAIADITTVSEEWRRLGDGYRVEAKFVIWEGRDILQVPAGGIFRKGEDWYVFVAESGRARLKQIKIGHRNGQTAEVISGIAEGQEVLVHPDDAVRDGARIKPRSSR